MLTLRLVLFLISLIPPVITVARADALDDLENEITGVWIVKVAGEDRSRTLKIYGLDRRSGEGFLLEADYGWSTGEKTPIVAEVIQTGQERRLIFTTQPGSKIVATQTSEGKFAGTFTPKKGNAKGVAIEKVSPDEFEIVQRTELNAVPKIEQPSANVPAVCASFVGGWTGTLPNAGRIWLWVVAMDSKCTATYYYGSSASVPKEFEISEVKEGTLIVPRLNGTAYFKINGGELARRYSGSDGENRSIMQKIEASADSIAKLRVRQVVDRPIAAPPDVSTPVSCAAFFGTWVGTWFQGNIGEQWLHVFGVDAKCVAKYVYTSAKSPPKIFHTAEIKNGYLSIACNGGRGTCRFSRSGNELSAHYDGPDGTNHGGFKKVK